jgi:predicted dehydrogenase
MKQVVLEGCNGEWAQACYLPFLASKAKESIIQLWAIDIESQIKLVSPKVAASWREVKNKGNARYLDKTGNPEFFKAINKANYVFIVTPDRTHCDVAETYMGRLNADGSIFIEKPLDASLKRARAMKNRMGGAEILYGFDHYLAKVYPLLQKHSLGKIGEISKIEFNILEAGGISAETAGTLDKGVIFDLFCHILAVVGVVLSRDASSGEAILKAAIIRDVVSAQYSNCPISGETYARIEFSIGSNTQVIATVGKGIGDSNDKCMIIYGEKGQKKLDFGNNQSDVSHQNQHQDKEPLEPRPVESFLNTILQQKQPLSAPGVFSFDAALIILEKLDEAKKKAGKMLHYNIGTSAKQIYKMCRNTHSASTDL